MSAMKIHTLTRFIPIIIILILMLGCSSSGSLSPDPIQDSIGTEVRGAESEHNLLAYMRVFPDAENLTIDAVPLREVMSHFNVKGFLTPPNCYGCIAFALNSFDPVTRIFDIDVTLKNPTFLTGYDVRGILIANNTGHEMVNADDYTKLYDDTTPADINPFKAFEVDDPQRRFFSYETDTQQILFRIPKPPNWAGFDYAVDASWPGHCREPYEIIDFTQIGSLAMLFDSATVSVTVHDWQDDVTEVNIDVTAIMGDVLQLENTGDDVWSGEVVNTQLPAPGMYRALVSAYSPNAPGWWLYDYVDILVSPPNYADRITFASNRTGNWDIFMMNPDGTDQQQLTFSLFYDYFPDFSPNERKIVFTSSRDTDPGPPMVDNEIYIYDIDTETVDKISDECEALFPNWSSGGNMMFITAYVHCMNIITKQIAYFPLGGGDTVYNVMGPQFFSYSETDFSPDESHVLFIGHTIGNFVFEFDFPSFENLTQLTTDGSEDYCTYSHDGSMIAYSSAREGNTDIYVLNLTSMDETRITFDPNVDTQPTWSPDGQQIAYVHYHDGFGDRTDIFVTSIDGQFNYNITNDPIHTDLTPCWSGYLFE